MQCKKSLDFERLVIVGRTRDGGLLLGLGGLLERGGLTVRLAVLCNGVKWETSERASRNGKSANFQ